MTDIKVRRSDGVLDKTTCVKASYQVDDAGYLRIQLDWDAGSGEAVFAAGGWLSVHLETPKALNDGPDFPPEPATRDEPVWPPPTKAKAPATTEPEPPPPAPTTKRRRSPTPPAAAEAPKPRRRAAKA